LKPNSYGRHPKYSTTRLALGVYKFKTNTSHPSSFWRRCREAGDVQYRGLFDHSRLGFLEKSKNLKNQKNLKKKIKIDNFHLPQFEHDPFWQYLSRLNDHHAQYVHFIY